MEGITEKKPEGSHEWGLGCPSPRPPCFLPVLGLLVSCETPTVTDREQGRDP